MQDFVIITLTQLTFQVPEKSSGDSVILKPRHLSSCLGFLSQCQCLRVQSSGSLKYFDIFFPGFKRTGKQWTCDFRAGNGSQEFMRKLIYFVSGIGLNILQGGGMYKSEIDLLVVFKTAGLMPQGIFWSTQVCSYCYR